MTPANLENFPYAALAATIVNPLARDRFAEVSRRDRFNSPLAALRYALRSSRTPASAAA